MPVMVQIRNVPDDLHRKFKARAAKQGTSLSEYLLSELEQIAALPTWEEMFARIDADGPVSLSVSSADLIRAERDSR